MKHLSIAVVFFALTISIFSCQPNVSKDMAKVDEQEKAYLANPTKETAAAYIAAVTLYAGQNPKTVESEELLLKAHDYALVQDQKVVAAGITNELIKQFPNSPSQKDRLVELTKAMDGIGKNPAAKALKYFYSLKYPNDPETIAFKGSLTDLPTDPYLFLKQQAEKIFENADVSGLNRTASFEYVDATEAFVMVNPKDTLAPNYLFNAAEIAKTVGTFKKALSLYDWVINNYPEHRKAPTAQFLKAFILEDNLKNIDAAKENYEKFIATYPGHHFVDDAKFSLKNLGKSNEEIQKELEALQKKNAAGSK